MTDKHHAGPRAVSVDPRLLWQVVENEVAAWGWVILERAAIAAATTYSAAHCGNCLLLSAFCRTRPAAECGKLLVRPQGEGEAVYDKQKIRQAELHIRRVFLED